MAKRLYVGGLSPNTNSDTLRQAFTEFGEVVEAKVISDRDSGKSRGFGFVGFADDAAGTTAIDKRNGSELDGSRISVSEARPRPEGGRNRSDN